MVLTRSITLTVSDRCIDDGSLLTNIDVSGLATAVTNDTRYLKLDGTKSTALYSSSTLTRTGKLSANGTLTLSWSVGIGISTVANTKVKLHVQQIQCTKDSRHM